MNNERIQDDALKEIMGFQELLVVYAYSVIRDWHLAEDVVQDVLVKLCRDPGAMSNARSLYPWVRTLVRHRAIDVIRKRSKEDLIEGEELITVLDQSFDEYLGRRAVAYLEQKKDAMQVCIKTISSDSLDMLMSYYRDKQSFESIGSLSNKSVDAIRNAIFRIRRQLRECVKKRMTVPCTV